VSGNRTEKPTPRRLREARRRGDVARSAELSAAGALAAGLLALAVTGPSATAALVRTIRAALLSATSAELDPAAALLGATLVFGRLAAPILLAAAAGGALTAALATGFAVTPGALRPRLERVDPFRGLRRLCSLGQVATALLGLAKTGVLIAVVLSWLRGAAGALAQLPRGESAALLRAAAPLGGLAARLAFVFAVFGLLDLTLSRRRHETQLRMTRDEVRREHKEDEGDPQHRAERRRIHRALAEAAPVSRATCVVVNPTHVAVALHHERDGADAPRVLAKGLGESAARIRSAARRAGVPIVRDVALARALYRLAEVGDEIPEELYEAAAAVLAHLYGREQKLP
jgi:type III secretion protein U